MSPEPEPVGGEGPRRLVQAEGQQEGTQGDTRRLSDMLRSHTQLRQTEQERRPRCGQAGRSEGALFLTCVEKGSPPKNFRQGNRRSDLHLLWLAIGWA